MFSIGFLEILLIFVIAVILLEPEDWPHLLYQSGRLFKKARIFVNHLHRSFDAFMMASELEEISKEAQKKSAIFREKPSSSKKTPHENI